MLKNATVGILTLAISITLSACSTAKENIFVSSQKDSSMTINDNLKQRGKELRAALQQKVNEVIHQRGITDVGSY